MRIDPHVHCRDWEQKYKATVRGTIKLALSQGIDMIFDMPNTYPLILMKEDVQRRLMLIPFGHERNYRLYVGLTADREQIEEALKCYKEFDEVIGFKLYAGRSVGPLAVIEEREQKEIYRILAGSEYQGVIAVHCEKERYLNPGIWDPLNPISHSWARPKEAEIASIKDQIRFAKAVNFKGALHIAHITCPESVEEVDRARKEIRITCGVTPHHLMWDDRILNTTFHKMNPPLRSEEDVIGLRKKLQEGKIDWIETDQAPHHVIEKLFPPYMSGFPSLHLYRYTVEQFLPINLGLSEEHIERLTFSNIYNTFKNKLKAYC